MGVVAAAGDGLRWTSALTGGLLWWESAAGRAGGGGGSLAAAPASTLPVALATSYAVAAVGTGLTRRLV